MKPIITPKKLLQEARKLVKKGWTQGMAERQIGDNMHYCASGAISAASKKMGADNFTRGVAELKLKVALNNDFMSVMGYNDADNRKKSQVLAKFDLAIKNA